jgi:hypothetical protein
MAAREKSNTHPSDIRRVLAPHKKKKLNVYEAQNTTDTVTVGDDKYYLNKGDKSK